MDILRLVIDLKKIVSILLSLSLVVGTLCLGVPSAHADESTIDTTDLGNILSTYFPAVSESLASDIVSETPYFLFQVVDYEGYRHYVLDTFSVTDLSNWHFILDSPSVWTPFQGNNDYFLTLDNLVLSGEYSYNLFASTRNSGTEVKKYSFTGSSVYISSTADPRFAQDCYAQRSTSETVFSTGTIYRNPFLIDSMTLYFVLSNTNLGNTGVLVWTDMVDTNFTDISVTGSSSDSSLNISWAESVYNSQLNYHYSEISLALFFDGVLTFKTFNSLTNPEYFPTSTSINVPFSFIVDVADLANNIDLFNRIKLGEITLSQYARVNDQSADVKGSAYTLCNVLLKPLGGPSYDDEYEQGVEPDNVFSDRPEGVSVQTAEYTYTYGGQISNILEKYPNGSDWDSAFSSDFSKYVPDWADVVTIDNAAGFSSGNIVQAIYNRIDTILDNYNVFDQDGRFSTSSLSGSLEPEEAYSEYTQLFGELSQSYFTDVAVFIYFKGDYAGATQLSATTVYVWFVYTNRYYQKVNDRQVVDVFTDYSSQLKDVADAVLNDYYNNYSLYTYLHAKLDDMERNQVNYFGTTTGLLGNLNDGITVIDSHLGFISSYLSSIDSTLDLIDSKLASTLSVSDTSVQSLLRDVIDAIESLDVGGGSSYENEIDTIQEAVEYYHSHSVSEAYDDNLYSVWFTGMVHDWWWNVNYDSSNRVHDSLLLDVFNTLRVSYNSLVDNSNVKGVMTGYFGALSGSSYDGSVYPDYDTKYMLFFFDGDFDPDTYEGVSYE